MRSAGLALLLVAAGCSSSDNQVVGFIDISTSDTTLFVQFDNIRSVINGTAQLFNADGVKTGASAEVVIISDQPGLCDRLQQHRDYFRRPPENYIALILFYPGTDHLGTFIPGRTGDEGTDSEVIGTTQNPDAGSSRQAIPFMLPRANASSDQPAPLNGPFMTLNDWSATAGGGAAGTFNLLYAAPDSLNLATSNGFQFGGRFRASACPTLDGTLLP
jgi:hypothetical protein